MPSTYQRKARSEREQSLLRRSSKVLACGIRSTTIDPKYGMVLKSGKGSRVTDCSGNEYIDYLLGSGPMFLGHSHPAMVKAVADTASNGVSFLLTNDVSIELAEKLVERVPCAEKISFHNSGSEATLYAMRLARAYRGRDKILKFEGAYHGMHDYALMSAQWTQELIDYPGAIANSAGIPADIKDNILVAPFNDLNKASEIIRQHADQLGCIVVEPLCRTFVPEAGFLQGLRDLATELDTPLVFDEVVTGFRLALGGAQEYYGVEPDLSAGAKAISGGLPFGFVGGRNDIMSLAGPAGMKANKHVRLTGTYSGNVVCCSVAMALINELEKPDVYTQVNARGQRLRDACEEIFAEVEIPVAVIGEATAFQLWFTNKDVTDHRSSLGHDQMMQFKLMDLLLDQGVLKSPEKFFTSTAHSDEDIDITIAAIKVAAAKLKA